MRLRRLLITFGIAILLQLSSVCLVYAGQNGAGPTGPSNSEVADAASTEFNRIGTTDIKIVFGRAIRVAMGIMGSLALAMFVYAGFLLMLSPGNSDHTEKARSILVWSSLGVFVIMASYALVNLIFQTF